MNKFTLFTLFLSAIIVVMVSEIMVNEYLRNPYSLQSAANVFEASTTQQDGMQTTGLHSSSTSQEQVAAGSLSPALLQNVGLQDYNLQTVPYSGKLFGQVAFNDLNFVPSFESHLMKQVANVANFYEFNPGSAQSAQEVYALVKQKCTAEVGVILNETNSFGDGSFYVNYFEYPQKVFLVFRKGTKVFALVYNKELHGIMTKLIGLL